MENEKQLDRVQKIPITELVPFKDHPFRVVEDESKVTMDIYAKVKYNKPEQLCSVVNQALKPPSSDRKEGQDES